MTKSKILAVAVALKKREEKKWFNKQDCTTFQNDHNAEKYVITFQKR